MTTNDEVSKKEKELEGTKKSGKQQTMYTLLECHVDLDLEGFEDIGTDGNRLVSSYLTSLQSKKVVERFFR